MSFRRRDLVFFVAFGVLTTTAWLWLIAGSAPLLASISDGLHDGLHRRGQGQGLVAQLARNAAQTSHATGSSSQAFFDYGFSLFNLGLGMFLIRLRPLDTTARLLSIGMVGTAIAFNLQGHDAFQVVPVASLKVVDQWHFWVHVTSGLCYMFALLLFPSGRRIGYEQEAHVLRAPGLVILALLFTMLSSLTVDDHTLGLVLVFGIFIPVTGVTAQIRRYRKEPNQEQRQQSKLLLWALLFALAIAVPLVFLTRTPPGLGSQKTLAYEFEAPPPGTYFFRCDPHPVDMKGRVVVTKALDGGAKSQGIDVSAENSEFDTEVLELAAGRPTTISFTNRDSDLHNVAIYLRTDASEPIFIGAKFSGQETAAVTFRVFRIIFIVIPIALFIGLIRFRLWDIDRVINRALVYGALAGFITLAYIGVVVGIGTAVGAGRGLNLFLSIAVTAALAWTFQPLRERARKLANRLVYGNRATPYEVLAQLSERVGTAYA
ncbi:MAG: hypothetical protein H0U53_01540, partial [Actinobacteria bacterium]|nr:hypothetical protein [Actinomycetota bacterium]